LAHVAHFGGNANNGTQAGLFIWNVNNASSNANRNIGARLNPLVLNVMIYAPHHLVKQLAIKSLVGDSEKLGLGIQR